MKVLENSDVSDALQFTHKAILVTYYHHSNAPSGRAYFESHNSIFLDFPRFMLQPDAHPNQGRGTWFGIPSLFASVDTPLETLSLISDLVV